MPRDRRPVTRPPPWRKCVIYGSIKKPTCIKLCIILQKHGILELKKDKIVATKLVSANDPNLSGHFKGFPIMPGALMVEGMGQAGTLLVRYNLENHWEKEVLAFKIKDAKFMEPTFPGSVIKYEIALMGLEDRGGMLTAVASVDGKEVATCQMILAVVDRKEFRGKYSSANK